MFSNPSALSDKSLTELRAAIAAEASRIGFTAFGVAPIESSLRREYYLQWLADGKHGEMEWMANSLERRFDATRILPEARSMIVLGQNYYQPELERRGRIAKYALGGDYHDLIYKRLKLLCTFLRDRGGTNKPYVDTGPVLEKHWATEAGIGWQGKHTNLIHPEQGNWLFLAVILTSIELPADSPLRDRCGSCHRCIDICPTKAITGPYQLDARRCISYLTIEHKGPIPEGFRRAIGNHLYGCDDCLDVCPWNRWAQTTRETKLAARPLPDLCEMLDWDDVTFREHFAGTPIKRIGLSRWLRNVCIVLGNTGTLADCPALERACVHTDSLIAEHASWAKDEIESRG
ncbi:MAG: tRNA epoxyqueuosine(34) reductase QueG [Verrucomicrobiota bacterium]|nr:tRNA epoxyqueuosine(34) reductase QueG [Verrucomicrobiota bacterium]